MNQIDWQVAYYRAWTIREIANICLEVAFIVLCVVGIVALVKFLKEY